MFEAWEIMEKLPKNAWKPNQSILGSFFMISQAKYMPEQKF